MSPIFDYLHMLRKYRPDLRFVPRALVYFLKLLIAEPFRLYESWSRTHQAPQAVQPPIFVLGYYRSGTTHLQEVLTQDQRFGYMNFYQGFMPTCFLSTERWLRPVFERIVRAVGLLHPAHQIPFGFALPAEEDVAMVFTGSRLAANWAQLFPRDFRTIYAKTGLLDGITPEETDALSSQMRALIAQTSKANGGRRLVLKSPPQTGRLALLLRMYPDAKFVFIRRDTYDCFGSNLKLWKSFEDQHLQSRSPDDVRQAIVWSYDQVHRAFERDKWLCGPSQLCELSFEELMAAPVATLERIYAELDLGGFEQARAGIEAYVAAHHRATHTPQRLSEADLELVEDHLETWLMSWDYHRNPPADLIDFPGAYDEPELSWVAK